MDKADRAPYTSHGRSPNHVLMMDVKTNPNRSQPVTAAQWRTSMNASYKTCFALVAAAFALTANAQELSGTLKKIKDTGAITIGHRESSIPFSYLDDKQQP